MIEIIFATSNTNKVIEFELFFKKSNYKFLSLTDINLSVQIPEPFDSFKENASIKVDTVSKFTDKIIISEDSGLEVEALNGEPGVRSSRYAGNECNQEKNICKLLDQLKNKKNRKARFITVICLFINKEKYFFEGICEGEIVHKKMGNNNFGYDPVFIPTGASKTFGEMTLSEKKHYSHREKAIDTLDNFLHKTYSYKN